MYAIRSYYESFLNPVWYAGSFTLGALAGALGDKWNLGFLAEPELFTKLGKKGAVPEEVAALLRLDAVEVEVV